MSDRIDEDWRAAHEIDPVEQAFDVLRGSAGGVLYELALKLTPTELCRLRADPRLWPALSQAIGEERLSRIQARIAAAEQRLVEDPAVFLAVVQLRTRLSWRIRDRVIAAIETCGEAIDRSWIWMELDLGLSARLEVSTADAIALDRREVRVELCQGPFQLHLVRSEGERSEIAVTGRTSARVQTAGLCPSWSDDWAIAPFELRSTEGRRIGGPGDVLWL